MTNRVWEASISCCLFWMMLQPIHHPQIFHHHLELKHWEKEVMRKGNLNSCYFLYIVAIISFQIRSAQIDFSKGFRIIECYCHHQHHKCFVLNHDHHHHHHRHRNHHHHHCDHSHHHHAEMWPKRGLTVCGEFSKRKRFITQASPLWSLDTLHFFLTNFYFVWDFNHQQARPLWSLDTFFCLLIIFCLFVNQFYLVC